MNSMQKLRSNFFLNMSYHADVNSVVKEVKEGEELKKFVSRWLKTKEALELATTWLLD